MTETAGAQSDLIRIRPTLLIGLGGTGGDVILRVRKRFYEKYGSLAEFPIVGYLWLDTDRSEKHILGKEIREFVRLTDTERLYVTIGDTTSITQNLKEPNYSHIDKWWYPGLNSLGQMNEGAGQIRAYSRLALFHHYQAIRAAITEANTKVRDPHAAERMMKSQLLKDQGLLTHVDFAQPTNVYVVSSIAGGTGSGMLMDIAFMIKEIFQEGNVTSSAYLVLPHHFGTITNERMKANAYALLKELNYYKFGVPHFEAEWQRGNTSKVPIPPFDYCYLFDNQNNAGQATGGQPGSQELIFELLADSIFKDFSHGEFADHKRSARINVRQYMNKTYDYEHPRFKQKFIQRYQSLGLASISVPHGRIITACAYKLAGEVIDLWGGLGKDAFNAADLPRVVKEDVFKKARLVETESAHDVLFALLDAGGTAEPDKGKNTGLLEELNKWRLARLRDIERGAHSQARMRLRDWLDDQMQTEGKRLLAEQLGPESEKWGFYPRTIRANLEALLTKASTGLRAQTNEMIDQKHESIGYVEAVLNECCTVLREYSAAFLKKAQTMQDQLARRQKEATRRLTEVAKYQSRANWDGRRGIILSYVADRYLESLVGDNTNPGYFRCELQDRVYKEGAEFCDRLIGLIQGSERPDGRRAGGMVDQMGQLQRDLQALKEDLKVGYSYFSQKDSQPQSLTLYEPTDIDKLYYPAYVRSKDVIVATSKAALARLERSVSGLSGELGGGRADAWKRALLAEARNRFTGIKNDFHVLKVLFSSMDDATRLNQLRQIFSRSAFWVTRSGVHGTFRLPQEQIHTMIGIPSPAPGIDPAGAAEIDTYTQQLRQLITRELQSDVNFYPIPDTSELIFYQEAGGFPINYMARLTDLRESYLKLYTAGEPLHMEAHDKKYPDLGILTKEERQALEEAHECYVLGCLFDILEFKGGEYLWMERDGFQMRPHPLGDRHMLLVKLSTNATTREKLFQLVKGRRNAVVGTQDVEELAAYVALLEHYKREAWGDLWGKVTDESELPFDSMMAVKVIKDELENLHDAPLVRRLGADEFGKRVGAVNPETCSKQRPDGKLALVVASSTS